GCRVLLVTRQSLQDGDWPREAIDETFYLHSLLERDELLKGVSFLARTRPIDRIVALDDFDVELAAQLREHLRVPGMGDTTARYFRDKLAMRVRARDAGILVPDFVQVLNYDDVRAYMARVAAPWFLKPRSEGSAAGIKKVNEPDALWPYLDEFGDRQSYYVLERYVPGDVYHVDAIVSEREVRFAEVSCYGQPPFDVMHGGGLFTTRIIPRQSPEVQDLLSLNREVNAALGFVRGVTHTEFIRGRDDGRFYFLETAARVGGAHIVEVIEAATDINLWTEWARIEIAGEHQPYTLPPFRAGYAGIVMSLARQQWPDTSAYDDPEIVWRLKKDHHAGLIVAAPGSSRVEQLIERFSTRFLEDFFASQPGLERLSR
ncbi:MAG: ATPase, partial [Vicinamibacterales bacterium]